MKHYLCPQFIQTIRNYSFSQFIRDIVAGLIVAVIALPLSIALALASGVEPACGVYTAIAAGFIVSLLGGSRVQIAGPTAAFATIVAGVVATQGMDGLFIATILAGILLIVMGVLKLGSLIRFIPQTITVGFTAGVAVTIFVGQIKDFFGLTYADGVKPIEATEKILANIEAIATFSLPALIIGLISLTILIVYPKLDKRIPPSLIAVIVGVLLVQFVPYFNEGVFTIGSLYTIPAGLPQTDFSAFNFSWDKIVAVIPSAFTIALLAGIESLLSCVVADGMIDSKHNSNAELVAQGLANIGSVCFGGIPATGAIARTAANVKNGGRTPVAGMIHSVILLLALLFLMPVASLIPMPTIAAILFIVAYNMSEYKKFIKLCKTAPKSDIIVLIVTFVLTVVFDLVVAIIAGLALTLILFLKRMSIAATVKESDSSTADAVIYLIEGPLFFGSKKIIDDINIPCEAQSLTLCFTHVTTVDSSALSCLEALARKCQTANVKLVLQDAHGQPKKALQKHGLISKDM